MKFEHFCCPICKSRLVNRGKSCFCEHNHCFDIAKENYLNLHVSQKNSDKAGDNKDMILARKEFLKSGKYAQLADKLVELVDKYSVDNSVLLDLGCGWGYYVDYIQKHSTVNRRYLGTDLSKEAIKIGGKLNKDVDFCIANSYHLPLLDKSVDMLLCVFSPYAIEEIMRVLSDNGKAIFVYPNDYHLWELKQSIYGESVHTKEFEVDFAPLTLIEKSTLNYEFELDSSAQIHNLITMTPYVYTTPKHMLERAESKEQMRVRADFGIAVLQKPN